MSSFATLFSCLLPTAIVVAVFFADRGKFGQLPLRTRQVVIGLLFGLGSVLSGIPSIQAYIPVDIRDTLPLLAGVLYGGPAGLVAGAVGAVFRLIAPVFWNYAAYSLVPSFFSSLMAGALGAALHIALRQNLRRAIPYCSVAVFALKIVEMMMAFIYHLTDLKASFSNIQASMTLLVLVNLVAVILTLLIRNRIYRKFAPEKPPERPISDIIQKALLICLSAAFIISWVFIIVIQSIVSAAEIQTTLALSLDDLPRSLVYSRTSFVATYTDWLAHDINDHPRQDLAKEGSFLDERAKEYLATEMYVIDADGLFVYSLDPSLEGENLHDHPASQAFSSQLGKDPSSISVLPFGPSYFYSDTHIQYVSIPLENGGLLVVGYDQEYLSHLIEYQKGFLASSRRIGERGYFLVVSPDGTIISDGSYSGAAHVTDLGPDIFQYPPDQLIIEEFDGTLSYILYSDISLDDEMIGIAVLPSDEAVFADNIASFCMGFLEISIFSFLFVLIYYYLKKLVVNNIQKVNCGLTQITEGNLDIELDVRGNAEFNSLSNGINATVTALKALIAKEAARIDQDLANAKVIQQAALPSALPDRKEFGISASMDAAKEVGGDFYDFYLLGEDRVAFLVADVSDKGIPAALFMMTAKTTLKSMTTDCANIAEAFTLANTELCANSAGMFVTAWMGVLDLSTGLLQYVNAGHNPPLIRQANGEFAFLRTRPNFILAGMKGVKYKLHELQLEPGDEIFLYTDGVTEALNPERKLYSEQRLVDLFNTGRFHQMSQQDMLTALREDIRSFADGASQADDITMLSLRFNERKDSDWLKLL